MLFCLMKFSQNYLQFVIVVVAAFVDNAFKVFINHLKLVPTDKDNMFFNEYRTSCIVLHRISLSYVGQILRSVFIMYLLCIFLSATAASWDLFNLIHNPCTHAKCALIYYQIITAEHFQQDTKTQSTELNAWKIMSHFVIEILVNRFTTQPTKLTSQNFSNTSLVTLRSVVKLKVTVSCEPYNKGVKKQTTESQLRDMLINSNLKNIRLDKL
uniref:Uncharacterized protein n=1 Tax=Glossina brevipalpis TaxID=37001 RepID=A0A1A9W099_9MUSC